MTRGTMNLGLVCPSCNKVTRFYCEVLGSEVQRHETKSSARGLCVCVYVCVCLGGVLRVKILKDFYSVFYGT
jgi:hypothetical protein